MQHKTIEPMNTLETFGNREMSMLIELLTAYNYANSTHNGKYYSGLPETWWDNGVYPEFNASSGEVFLSNADYQALTLTDYGVAMFYNTPYYGNEGTVFELCADFQENTSNADLDMLPIDEWHRWNKDDANYLYRILDLDLEALAHTEADLTDCYRVKDLILEAFVLDGLQDTLEYLKNKGEDWNIQLHDDDWWESDLADELMGYCLKVSDFENEIHDTDDYEKWAEFLRTELVKLTIAE